MSDLDAYRHEEGDRPMERSPRGRYIRFDIRLGAGAYKVVYKAYDTDQGIDVAWNAIDIGVLPSSEKTRIIQEVQLLQKLEHKNIINFYGSWFSKEKNQVVFITEIMTSGTLKSYIKRVQFVKWKIIKRWCIQILEGLHYLHSQSPPIIHRDLKCDNIFINGNTGDLRIGDLGLSTQLAVHKRSKAQSVLGTPEFMAPELYDESYDEKVDIYAFGMCVLEMVTKEVPYSECINPAQIYKKVTAGIRPRGLQRIMSQPARDFIELCLSRGNGMIDVSAEYLLDHPFLKASDDDGEMIRVLSDDELEREAPPPPPRVEVNPKAFADELNMESGSKGKDDSAMGDQSKVTTSLSLAPEALGSGSANSSMALPSASSSERNDAPAEEKSAGKHRMHMPPSTATAAVPKPAAVSDLPPAAPPPVPLPTPTTPAAPATAPEPVMDEPLSDKKEVNHSVDRFLSGLPPTEVNIRNDRIAVMGGRGHRIEIDEVQTYSDDEAEKHNPTSPSSHATTMTVTSQDVHRSQVSTATSQADSEQRQRSQTVDLTRPARPPSARKRGKRYDIKATKDPENDHSILLNLRIALDGKSKEIKFPFNLFTDSSHEVACELAVDVGILEPDLEDIADSISFLVTEGKINNLPDLDQDIWDEAPEPHSFPSKPLPHVSKLTFGSMPEAQALLSMQADAEGGLIFQPRVVAREGSTTLLQDGPSGNVDIVTGADAGSAFSAERDVVLQPPAVLSHAASENALYNIDDVGSPEFEHGISMGSSSDANYIRAVKHFEDRIKLARSAFDERESSLEAAIKSEEEKHQREIERIRKKMQQFSEKTARATMARQERMRLDTDEFRSDSESNGDDWKGVNTSLDSPGVAGVPSVIPDGQGDDTRPLCVSLPEPWPTDAISSQSPRGQNSLPNLVGLESAVANAAAAVSAPVPGVASNEVSNKS